MNKKILNPVKLKNKLTENLPTPDKLKTMVDSLPTLEIENTLVSIPTLESVTALVESSLDTIESVTALVDSSLEVNTLVKESSLESVTTLVSETSSNLIESVNTLVHESSLESVTTLVSDTSLEVVNTLVEEASTPLAMANTLVEESSLLTPLEVVNTMVEESTTPLAMVNTLVEESTTQFAMVNTIVEESSTPLEVVNTLVEESTTPLEVVNTLVEESTTPLAMANTLVEESSAPLEVVKTLVEESSTPLEVVNTLVEESTLPLTMVNTLVEESSLLTPLEVVNTLHADSSELPSKVKTILPTLLSFKRNTIKRYDEMPVFSPKEKKEKEKENNQDTIQKLSVLSTLVLELYRMLSSSLLILFVPQSCGGSLCSISDNLTWNSTHHQYNFGICINFITLFIFSCLYAVELRRENRLIKYLEVNPKMPSSNEAVETTLANMDLEKKQKIISVDKQYQHVSYLSIGMYAFNSIVSGVIISHYYFGSQTTTSFITSILFMFTKLMNVYQVSNTEKHVFYSSYMKTFVQFNDLDETHMNPDNL